MGEARPGEDRFPLLDPLRALAAISILLVHVAYFARAYDDPIYGRFLAHLDIGVPFFFLLSAFLLYRPFVAARVDGVPRTRFWEYAKRRFVRVVPAYWAVLAISAVVPGMAGAFSGNWWAYWGLLQSYPIYTPTGTCATDPYHCAIPVAWSLTIEVLFYALLPVIVLVMAWLAARIRRPLILELGLVAVLTAVSIPIQGSVPLTKLHTFLFFSPFGRGWWFALGLGLAALSVHITRMERRPAWVEWIRRFPGAPVLAGAALYLFTVVAVLGRTPTLAFPVGIGIHSYLAQYILFGVIAALVILPAVFGTDGGGLTRRVLAHRSLVWLGLVSYGIFLWQFPAMVFIVDTLGVSSLLPLTVLALALTVACAAGSFYLLERPLMRRVRSRPGAGGAALGSASEELAEVEGLEPVSPSARA